MTIEHVVPDEPLQGHRVDVGLLQPLLLAVEPIEQFLVHRYGVEGQQRCNPGEPGMNFVPVDLAPHFEDDPAGSDRGLVGLDAALAASHPLAALGGDRLVRGIDAEQGEALVLLEVLVGRLCQLAAAGNFNLDKKISMNLFSGSEIL